VPARSPEEICRRFQQAMADGDVALMHTAWTAYAPHPVQQYAIEVARRQADGSWRWLVGDPFTVDANVGSRVARGAGSPGHVA
jgi:hypothetical protein